MSDFASMFQQLPRAQRDEVDREVTARLTALELEFAAASGQRVWEVSTEEDLAQIFCRTRDWWLAHRPNLQIEPHGVWRDGHLRISLASASLARVCDARITGVMRSITSNPGVDMERVWDAIEANDEYTPRTTSDAPRTSDAVPEFMPTVSEQQAQKVARALRGNADE